jgi:hypothetical protein
MMEDVLYLRDPPAPIQGHDDQGEGLNGEHPSEAAGMEVEKLPVVGTSPLGEYHGAGAIPPAAPRETIEGAHGLARIDAASHEGMALKAQDLRDQRNAASELALGDEAEPFPPEANDEHEDVDHALMVRDQDKTGGEAPFEAVINLDFKAAIGAKQGDNPTESPVHEEFRIGDGAPPVQHPPEVEHDVVPGEYQQNGTDYK